MVDYGWLVGVAAVVADDNFAFSEVAWWFVAGFVVLKGVVGFDGSLDFVVEYFFVVFGLLEPLDTFVIEVVAVSWSHV